MPVDPVRPVAGYIGGKRNLAKRLIARIGETPHSLYAEPFIGMGGVFFRRDRRPPVEAINDISADVTTLFRILQRHLPQFLDTLKYQLASRAEFDRLMRVDASTLTDLERAARFLYLQRMAFGGKVVGRHYGVQRTGGARFDLTKLVPMLDDVHDRLCGVHIERLPWADFITRYDTPGTLFYLDPPYHGSEGDYGPGVFGEADFAAMAAQLREIEGQFFLSLNASELVKDTFAGFAMEEVFTRYQVGGMATSSIVPELIIQSQKG